MVKAHDISHIVGGALLQSGQDYLVVDNLIFDTRKIFQADTSVFIPLVTPRRNAHQYLEAAYASGVRCFIVSQDSSLPADAWIIRVENTLHALQKLAAAHRQIFSIPVLAITGSNGKTVIKEWLYQLLQEDYSIARSPKSYNSQIGVPLSVWQLNKQHNMAIFEAGISLPGEMHHLEKIIQPTLGLFTNIGDPHNEGFLDRQQKINEKLQLFTHVNTLFYCKDYTLIDQAIESWKVSRKPTLITWSRHSPATIQVLSQTQYTSYTHIQFLYNHTTHNLHIPFTDAASIENVIHCVLIMLYLQIEYNTIQQRISKLSHIPMRLDIIQGINQCSLINDSYSSDLSSLQIALDLLAQQTQYTRKTIILSDILQTGDDQATYLQLAKLLAGKQIQRLIAIGSTIATYKNLLDATPSLHTSYFETTEQFLQHIHESDFQNECILIKGARSFGFERITNRLQEKIHQSTLEINLNALAENLKVYQSYLAKSTKIMAMVKAYSYGSGTIELANRLQFEQVDYLAVAYTDEGVLLRKKGITLPIMVMNPDEHSYTTLLEWKLEPEIYNFKSLHALLRATQHSPQPSYPLHIKLDTGMHRLGFENQDISRLIEIITQNPTLHIKSIFSHLAASGDSAFDDFTRLQGERFNTMSQQLLQAFPYPILRHLCNSSGILRHPSLHFDMVRLGLGLYGIESIHPVQQQLHTVGTLKTTIAQIKTVAANETVGYSRQGLLSRDTRIATVCIGYADGIPRRMGNGKAYMLLHGQPAPIIGNVCMDMCMLDITDIEDVHEGDEVEVFGSSLPVSTLALWADTIPYEILTGISQRVKRVYYQE